MTLREFIEFTQRYLYDGALRSSKPDRGGYTSTYKIENFDKPAAPRKANISYWDRDSDTENDKNAPYISVSWRTGGLSGGSCWDDGSKDVHYATEGDPPEELELLDTLLEKVKPDIGFLQYKALCAKVVHHDSYSVGEYYGNYTNYAVKYVAIPELYEYLLEKGWLPA